MELVGFLLLLGSLLAAVLAAVMWLRRERENGRAAVVDAEPLAGDEPGSKPPVGGSPRVLVAEDNRISACIIEAHLIRMGCSVTLVANGEEALQAAATEVFSLAVIDLSMPGVGGIEFARQYRAREGDGRHLPIVALTASDPRQVKAKCLAAGMDDVLGKPVAYARLAALIGRIEVPSQ